MEGTEAQPGGSGLINRRGQEVLPPRYYHVSDAGPGGAVPGKPVGLVHFAVAARDGRISHREQRFGAIGRSNVRQRSVVEALRMLLDLARVYQAAR